MIGSDGKPKSLPFTRLARLDGLGINLVTVETLFEEQFKLILKEIFLEYSAKGLFSTLCCSTNITRIVEELTDLTNELRKELPSVREGDHKIKLVYDHKIKTS